MKKGENFVSISLWGSVTYREMPTFPFWEHKKIIRKKFCKVKTILGLLLEYQYEHIFR